MTSTATIRTAAASTSGGSAPAPLSRRLRLVVPALVFACLVSAVVSSLGAPLLPAMEFLLELFWD